MSVYYNPKKVEKIKRFRLVIDTNVLSSCFSNVDYFKRFIKVFRKNEKLLDPIVRLEFLRGAYTKQLHKERTDFLRFNQFFQMIDHPEIYKKINKNAINIAHIYAHRGFPDIPLPDLLITSRLKIYPKMVLLTIDSNDFPSFLFDRLGVVSIEKRIKKRKIDLVEHIHILKFSQRKYKECFSILPTGFKKS